MDELSSFHIAAAVIEFLDFSSNILITGYGDDSIGEAPEESLNVRKLPDDLRAICRKLATCSAQGQKEDESALPEIAQQCQRMAYNFSEVLDKLGVLYKGKARTWGAVCRAVNKMFATWRIDYMQKELETIRIQLGTHLIGIMRYVFSV